MQQFQDKGKGKIFPGKGAPMDKGMGKPQDSGPGPGKDAPQNFDVMIPRTTACTIVLHGSAFSYGREDIVLNACEQVARDYDVCAPDYATVVLGNLCHVEFSGSLHAVDFYNATGGSMKINNKNVRVDHPASKKGKGKKGKG